MTYQPLSGAAINPSRKPRAAVTRHLSSRVPPERLNGARPEHTPAAANPRGKVATRGIPFAVMALIEIVAAEILRRHHEAGALPACPAPPAGRVVRFLPKAALTSGHLAPPADAFAPAGGVFFQEGRP
jgi:hypothetical protein